MAELIDYSQYGQPAEEEKDVTITPTQKVESGLIDYSEYTPETTTSSIIPPKKNTYEGIKSDANMRARAVRFAKNHLGHDNINEDEAIDEFIDASPEFKAAFEIYEDFTDNSRSPENFPTVVSNETGGATMAFYDGSDWRRIQDRAVIS